MRFKKRMDKLNLRNMTLVSVNCLNPHESIRAIENCLKSCWFEKVLLLSDSFITHHIIESTCIHPIENLNQYSEFVLKRLYDYIKTDYCLVVQPDGFILNPNAWDDSNYNFDYIGAPWSDFVVGNGGFSLRSRRFLYVTKNKLNSHELHPEDVIVCKEHRELLIQNGIDFAPYEVAKKFSVENLPYEGQFGFHGKLTMGINNIRI